MKRILLFSLFAITALHAQEETPKNSTATWTDIAKDFGYLTAVGFTKTAFAIACPSYYFASAGLKFLEKNFSCKTFKNIEHTPSQSKDADIYYVNCCYYKSTGARQIATFLATALINPLVYADNEFLNDWPITCRRGRGDAQFIYSNNKPAFHIFMGMLSILGITAFEDHYVNEIRKFVKKQAPEHKDNFHYALKPDGFSQIRAVRSYVHLTTKDRKFFERLNEKIEKIEERV